MTDIGTPSEAHSLLNDYYNDPAGEIATDDTNALLGALVMELKARRRLENGPENVRQFLAAVDQTNPQGRFSGDYDRIESESAVTIQPGETAAVLSVNVENARWVASGTTDRDNSRYRYVVDGDAVLSEPLRSPLGLFNDLRTFPEPITARDSIRVDVLRTEDAPGAAEYVSNVEVFE